MWLLLDVTELAALPLLVNSVTKHGHNYVKNSNEITKGS